jgi:hypothetical protein
MSIKHAIRDWALVAAPHLTLQILSWRSQRQIIASERKSGRLAASKEFVRNNGPYVLGGPFVGLEYPKRTIAKRNLVGKLLASYEDELHDFVEASLANPHTMIVNVGSADGYYSVGYALRAPKIPVIAFDTDPWARRATRDLAILNGVQNVRVKSMCTPEWLGQNLKEGSLILSDCEGYETVLLDPAIAPHLKSATILVEIHEHNSPGAEETIRHRFAYTHDINFVTSREKNPENYKALAVVPEEMRAHVISEGRGRYVQNWLLLAPILKGSEEVLS